MSPPEPIWQLSRLPYGMFSRVYLALEGAKRLLETFGGLTDGHYSLLRSLKGVALTKWTHHAR